jgi:hypothetical protein
MQEKSFRFYYFSECHQAEERAQLVHQSRRKTVLDLAQLFPAAAARDRPQTAPNPHNFFSVSAGRTLAGRIR